MKTSRVLLGICLGLAIACSASAQKLFIDYDHKAPFSDYRTYKWLRKPQSPDPFMADRIVEAVNAQLSARGWHESRDQADVGITANVATRRARTVERFYSGAPGWGWRWRWRPGYVTTTVNSYPMGSLVIDIFDAKDKGIVWRGAATQALSANPDKNTKKLSKAVEKLFKKFPPQTAESRG